MPAGLERPVLSVSARTEQERLGVSALRVQQIAVQSSLEQAMLARLLRIPARRDRRIDRPAHHFRSDRSQLEKLVAPLAGRGDDRAIVQPRIVEPDADLEREILASALPGPDS